MFPTTGTPIANFPTRIKAALVAIVLALAGLSTFSGSGDQLPLDTHDVMVALTTQEMMQRDDYLVPYINAEPRLKKPPMNYWMVKAVDLLHYDDRRVTPWEARLPSAIAGVILAGVTIALGVVFVGWEVGLLGALFLICCRGFISFSHSARPEMVYAAFCGLAMLALALSDKWERAEATRRRARWTAYAAWLAMGLASVTKGPQLPLAIVLGQVIGLWATGERGRILRVLRPFVGFAILAAVALPWVIAVRNAVADAALIWQGEVAARTGRGNDPLHRYFYPYYLYMPAVLLLPWVAFLPLIWAAPWLERWWKPEADLAVGDAETEQRNIRKLWWWVVATALMLNIVWGRREYYMLPMLAPMTLLAAHGAIWLGGMLRTVKLEILWQAFRFVITLGAGAFVVYMWMQGSPGRQPTTDLMVLGVLFSVLALVPAALFRKRLLAASLYTRERTIPEQGQRSLRVVILASAALAWTLSMAIGSSAGAHWGINRFQREAFASSLNDDLDPPGKFFGWKEQWYIEAYRLNTVIPVLKDIDDIREQVEANGVIYVLFRPKKRPIHLPASLVGVSVRRLDSITSSDDEDGTDPLEMWRIEPARTTSQPATQPAVTTDE